VTQFDGFLGSERESLPFRLGVGSNATTAMMGMMIVMMMIIRVAATADATGCVRDPSF
jgi:hypothetical protein